MNSEEKKSAEPSPDQNGHMRESETLDSITDFK